MPVDFGTDLALLATPGGWDLPAHFALTAGRANLAAALARRFVTPRGTLRRHPEYGEDLRAYVREKWTPQTRLAAQVRIAAQAERDPRVLAAAAEVTLVIPLQQMTVRLSLETADGPFELVLAASAAAVAVLKAA
jgi:hypothetical protein